MKGAPSCATDKDEYKVVVLGERGVGKTSLVCRFMNDYFTPKQESTIGAFFLTKKMMTSNGSSWKMQLWDTAGQERFRSMAKLYYRNASAVIVCFDITDEVSWAKLKDWIEEISSSCSAETEDLIYIISCNKTDLESSRTVSQSRVVDYASRFGAAVFETSAKDDLGIRELFQHISEQVFEKKMKNGRRSIAAGSSTGIVSMEKKTSKSVGGCC